MAKEVLRIQALSRLEHAVSQGKTFYRTYTGNVPYEEQKIRLSKGTPFGVRLTNTGAILEVGGKNLAISTMVYWSLLRMSVVDKDQ